MVVGMEFPEDVILAFTLSQSYLGSEAEKTRPWNNLDTTMCALPTTGLLVVRRQHAILMF